MADPITPPPVLVQQWASTQAFDIAPAWMLNDVATQAAQWGADQELEACCIELTEKIITNSFYEGDKTESSWRELASIVVRKLRAARRPKPPSLKEQALQVLRPLSNPVMLGTPEYRLYEPQAEIIRRALEALPND